MPSCYSSGLLHSIRRLQGPEPPLPPHSIAPSITRVRANSMRYYKPMLYTAMAVIYASLGFRVFRLSYISNKVGQQRRPG